MFSTPNTRLDAVFANCLRVCSPVFNFVISPPLVRLIHKNRFSNYHQPLGAIRNALRPGVRYVHAIACSRARQTPEFDKGISTWAKFTVGRQNASLEFKMTKTKKILGKKQSKTAETLPAAMFFLLLLFSKYRIFVRVTSVTRYTRGSDKPPSANYSILVVTFFRAAPSCVYFTFK